MAAPKKRLNHQSGGLGDKPRKRRKVDHAHPTISEKKSAGVGTLPWQDVALPDRLDNYEGFFGLEEVDDVDVVKDGATGKLSFVPKITQAEPPNEHLEEEWSGFSDTEAATAIPAKSVPTERKKKSKPAKPTKVKPAKATDSFNPLSQPDNAEDVDVSAWRALKLSPDTMASLGKLTFSKPTPIQRSAVPEILAGHDVIGKASTGSGKTLAFGIPILERFLETHHTSSLPKGKKAPLALILSPTRELAHQLEKHLTALCCHGLYKGPSIATLTGGLSLQKQQRLMKDADIVIGTPGRLWEVMGAGQGTIKTLQQIQFLVIDEADRLLSEGNFKEVEEILDALDRQEEAAEDEDGLEEHEKKAASPDRPVRQTLVFSATFDRGLQRKLAGKGKPGGELVSNKESMDYLLTKLNFREEKPKFVDVNPVSQLAAGLKEGLIECTGPEKDLYLYTILLLHRNTRALVFTNSIDAVRRITPLLQNLDLPAQGLHSGMVQKARLRSLERFTQAQNKSSILVATDVAARGLDIPNVQLVIHYHLPRAADMYVHRSGRTARAGQSGSSILICGPEEVASVRRLVAKVHAKSAAAHQQSASDAAKQGYYIRTLDIDRRIVSRLKPRATLAKKIADTTIAKEKGHKQDDFFRNAAEELGVEYDSEELDKQDTGRRGRGGQRKAKERQARKLTKAEAGAIRAELRALLKQRVNVGVSEKYLTSGGVDIEELLRQQEDGKSGEFLGNVNSLSMD